MLEGKINPDEFTELTTLAQSKIPELKSIQEAQSGISKAISLGYMSLTSSAAVYGEALEAGYDKRTAGFAALAATAGNYGIMNYNKMGDWFLDQTTGYNRNVNSALIKKSVNGYLEDIQKAVEAYKGDAIEGKTKLAGIFGKIKDSIHEIFTSPSVVGESILKNSLIQGSEMVAIQAVSDATKGMIDTMSYLGMTKKKGSFNTIDNVFSEKGYQAYLSTLVGGIIGGAVFEFNRTKIEP
jgi:hypothetical protein